LSLCQKIPLTGAAVVSTPQDLAFNVAEKAISMFTTLRTPVLGLVENMSGFECRHCGQREGIFGSGGARRFAASTQACWPTFLEWTIRTRPLARVRPLAGATGCR
jgi:ATP-binding protein involved in chromosome partitioning